MLSSVRIVKKITGGLANMGRAEGVRVGSGCAPFPIGVGPSSGGGCSPLPRKFF